MDCVSSESDSKDRQMDKFDFKKPIKVTCIFEDSDSDENIVENAQLPDSTPVQCLSPQHSTLKDLISTPPIDNNNCQKNDCFESMENTMHIGNEKLNTHGNFNSNVLNTNAGPLHDMRNLPASSHTYIENHEASNSNYRVANEKQHYLNMLDTISETLITLAKYYHYYNTKYKKDHSVKEEYMNRRNEQFNQIYDLSLSLLVPQEHNKEFIRSFILRTIEIAHRKQWHHYMEVKTLEIIVGGLIIWTKQKKKYHESSNNEATPITMPVKVPTSNNNNTRQPISQMTPVSTGPLSNSYLNKLSPPTHHSYHNVLSPTVPEGPPLSSMVETVNRVAPIATPAQSIPPVKTPSSRSNVQQRMNEASVINQSPIPVSDSGFNVQKYGNVEASLTSVTMYNIGSNVQQLMIGSPSILSPSILSNGTPFSSYNRSGIQQQNIRQSIPQVLTSNNGFNVQHQINGAHSVSAMPIFNSRFNVQYINREHSMSAVPTSNSIFHLQQQMSGAPYIPPVPTSNSVYNVQHGPVPVAMSNNGLNAHQRINGQIVSPIAKSNSSSNNAKNIQRRKNSSPGVSPTTKSKSAPYDTNNVKQRMNSQPAISPITNTQSAAYGTNNVQQQMNGVPMSGTQPMGNLAPPASNNTDLNGKTPTDDANNTIRLFSTGALGNEMSISIDQAVMNNVICEKDRELIKSPSKKRPKTINGSKQPKKTCKSTWHPPCNNPQQIIETNHSQIQLNIKNGENINKNDQSGTSLPESENYNDEVSCEIPFRARSVSRDSGFGSPVLSSLPSDNNTVTNYYVMLNKNIR